MLKPLVFALFVTDLLRLAMDCVMPSASRARRMRNTTIKQSMFAKCGDTDTEELLRCVLLKLDVLAHIVDSLTYGPQPMYGNADSLSSPSCNESGGWLVDADVTDYGTPAETTL